MACLNPEGIMDQEQKLMSFFAQAATISVQGRILHITTTNGDILIFEMMDGNK